MSKVFKNHLEGLSALHRGMRALSDAVVMSIGPQGSLVVIKEGQLPPRITKQGSVIAQAFCLLDPFENMGLKFVKDISVAMRRHVGDGSKTVILLTEALFALSLKGVASGLDPLEIKQGIVLAGNMLMEEITKLAVPQIEQERQEPPLPVKHESLVSEDTQADYVLHSGYLSSYFVTHPDVMEVRYERAYILLYRQAVSNDQVFIHFLEKISEEKKIPLILIAEDFDPQFLSILIVNKIRGGLPICAIALPKERGGRYLDTLSAMSGATLIYDEDIAALNELGVGVLGRVAKVVIREKVALFFGEGCARGCADVSLHLEDNVPLLMTGQTSLSLEEPPAPEQKCEEYKERYLPGGGAAFIHAADNVTMPPDLSKGAAFGFASLMQAVELPFKVVVANCGLSSSDMLNRVRDGHGGGHSSYACEDLLQGVRDPLTVVELSLKNAISTVCVLLTSSFFIASEES